MSAVEERTRRSIEDRLFVAAAPERLAVLRILVGSFSVVYMAVRFRAFLTLADAAPSRFDPVGVLVLLEAPLSSGILTGVVVASLVLGIAFTAGLWFRISGPAFGASLLAATTYRSSWGQLLHFENLLLLHTLIVGFARSADALSLDARRRLRSARVGRGAATGRRPVQDGEDPAYGWPVRLAGVVTVVTYVLAGVAKVRVGGMDWMVGDTLRNHAAYSAARLELLGGTASPIAGPLVAHAWVFPPFATASVVLELVAPVALLGGRIRTAWVTATWVMHASIAALMYVVFPYPLFLVAFAPFYRLELLPDRIDRALRGASPSAVAGRG